MPSKARRMATSTSATTAPIEPLYFYQTMANSTNIDGGQIDGILDSNISSIIDDMMPTQNIDGGTV